MQSLKEFTMYTKASLTVREAYALLANTEALGATESLMVENAGFAVATFLKRQHRQDRLLFVCGTGGMGAIGLSAARHSMMQFDMEVVLVGDPSELHNSAAKKNYELLADMMDIHSITSEGMDKFRKLAKWSDDIIDSITGIGMKGRLTGQVVGVIKAINESRKYTISIDVPSGINATTGMKNMAAVVPDLVLAIHKVKAGVEKSRPKELTTLDIGLPITAELFVGPGDVMLATQPRSVYTNKYENGSVLILGGGARFKGAPVLGGYGASNALSALKAGSGYVTILAPKSAAHAMSMMSPELIVNPMSSDTLQPQDVASIGAIKHDVLIFGSGIDPDIAQYKPLKALLDAEKKAGKPVVIDGTGLKLISKYKNLITSNMVLTPHDGEFKALSGKDTKQQPLYKRIYSALDFAKTYGCTLVLKGHDTIITDGKLLKINRAKTPVLATMGTGDILAGIIASYAALNSSLFESAAAAVYVHAVTGDRLYAQRGMHITAQDVLDGLPETMKQFDIISPKMV